MTNGKNWLSGVFAIFVILLAFAACTGTTSELSDKATEEPDLPTQNTSPTPITTAVPPATDEVAPTQTTLPLPTNFFITSTPHVGSTQPEAIQAPEGKFLFIELIVTHDGKGDLPFAFIDRPLYHYDAERNVLQSGHSLSALKFDSASLGFLGTSIKRQGAAGSGSSAGLSTLSELPFSSILQVFNGNMKEYSEEMDEVEVTLVAIYEDGTVELALGGSTITLTSGMIWSHHVGIQILSERFDGFYEVDSQIINHGWLDREIIRANP